MVVRIGRLGADEVKPKDDSDTSLTRDDIAEGGQRVGSA